MPEFLAQLGSLFGKGVRTVATGQTQANLGLQSPHLASAAVRLGRFGYFTLGGWITFGWYTGYVNQRLPQNESWVTKFILPGSRKKVISPPDRPNKTISLLGAASGGLLGPAGKPLEELVEGAGKVVGISNAQGAQAKGRTLVALAPNQLGVPGTAVAGYLWTAPNGEKQLPPYNRERYLGLMSIAQKIAQTYGLKISSGYRPGSTAAGGRTDLHNSGLAFDLVGSMNNMKRAAVWAAKSPGMFQEIFIHNEGSGMHLHIGFYPDAAQIFASASNRYNRAGTKKAPAGAVSPQATTT